MQQDFSNSFLINWSSGYTNEYGTLSAIWPISFTNCTCIVGMHYGGGGICSCIIENSNHNTTGVIHFMQNNGYYSAGWYGRVMGIGY